MTDHLLKELLASANYVSKKVLGQLDYTFPFFQEVELFASSFDEVAKLRELSDTFQRIVLNALKTEEIPDDQVGKWIKQLEDWLKHTVEGLSEHQKQVDELLVLLEEIHFVYETSECIPKILAFHLFKLVEVSMKKSPICIEETGISSERGPIKESYSDIYERIKKIYTVPELF